MYDIEGRPVAVKMLQLKQKELDGGAPYLEGFDAQVVSLVALRNPHLVEIYGKVESSPFTYFMEYIPETTLEKYIGKNVLAQGRDSIYLNKTLFLKKSPTTGAALIR